MNKFHVAISAITGCTVIASMALYKGYNGGLAITICSALASLAGGAIGFALGRNQR